MDFFKTIATHLGEDSVTIEITQKGGKITVLSLPKGDNGLARKRLVGSPEEVDEGFFTHVVKPPAAGLQVSEIAPNGEKGAAPVKEQEAKQPTKKATTKTAKPLDQEPPAAETGDSSATQEKPSPEITPKEVSYTRPKSKFKEGDRVVHTGPGMDRGTVGTVQNDRPTDAGEIDVNFDFGVGIKSVHEKDLSPYEGVPAEPSSTSASVAPPPPAPPKPAPPKPVTL